jgi:hypothetical protein
LYNLQKEGPPQIVKNDYICINEKRHNYGRVMEVNGKTIKYNPITVKDDYVSDALLRRFRRITVSWTTPAHLSYFGINQVCVRRHQDLLQMGKCYEEDMEEFMIPEQHLFRKSLRSPVQEPPQEFGEEKSISVWKCKKVGHYDNWEEKYRENKKLILEEIHKRQRFWLQSRVLQQIPVWGFTGWFDMDYDIIGKKERPDSFLPQDELWTIVKDVIQSQAVERLREYNLLVGPKVVPIGPRQRPDE